jgi:hypothetical protein
VKELLRGAVPLEVLQQGLLSAGDLGRRTMADQGDRSLAGDRLLDRAAKRIQSTREEEHFLGLETGFACGC